MVGQAKTAIYVIRRNEMDNLHDQHLILMFKNLIKSRITVDLKYYKAMKYLETFALQWCYNEVFCVVVEEDLIF